MVLVFELENGPSFWAALFIFGVLGCQLARRNVSAAQRVYIVMKIEGAIAERAKANQKEHGGTAPGKGKTLCQISDKVIDTKKEAARMARPAITPYPKSP